MLNNLNTLSSERNKEVYKGLLAHMRRYSLPYTYVLNGLKDRNIYLTKEDLPSIAKDLEMEVSPIRRYIKFNDIPMT